MFFVPLGLCCISVDVLCRFSCFASLCIHFADLCGCFKNPAAIVLLSVIFLHFFVVVFFLSLSFIFCI